MTTLNISLPEPMKTFVEGEVAQGGYSSTSEYVRSLIREAQKRKAQEKLEALLLAGLESGEPIEVTPEYWEKKRKQLEERLKKSGKK